MKAYLERRYAAGDGKSLYYREYGDPLAETIPMLCLGFSRNSRDFQELAMRHAPGRRVICPDYRGRGRSDYDQDPKNYHPKNSRRHSPSVGCRQPPSFRRHRYLDGRYPRDRLECADTQRGAGHRVERYRSGYRRRGLGAGSAVSRQRQSAIRLGDSDCRFSRKCYWASRSEPPKSGEQ